MAGARTEAAVGRLGKALSRLEAAVALSAERRGEHHALASDQAHLERDRDRLAEELTAAEARAARLAHTNESVARRLIALMEDVRRLPGEADR